MSYVDLHLHLLPGVDDGPSTLRESLEHARRMVADGVCEAVVTPHIGHPSFDVDPRGVARRTRDLQRELVRAGIGLRLAPGGELHPSAAARLGRTELQAVAQGPPGARWLLAEVPFGGIDEGFLAGCADVRGRGFGLVIAHPERAAGVLDGGLRALRGELAAGSVLQVNVCSLLGRHGAEAQRAGERLVRGGLAYVLGSDGHGGRRGHTLAAGLDAAVAAGASPLRAWQLTQANPRFLLRHGLPPAPTPPGRPWRSRDRAPFGRTLVVGP